LTRPPAGTGRSGAGPIESRGTAERDLDDALHRLADAHGIATEFWDWRGRHVAVSNESITRVLGALGVDAATPESAG